MNKGQLERENSQLKAEIRRLRKVIEQLGDLNKEAFNRLHQAEGRLNQIYAER